MLFGEIFTNDLVVNCLGMLWASDMLDNLEANIASFPPFFSIEFFIADFKTIIFLLVYLNLFSIPLLASYLSFILDTGGKVVEFLMLGMFAAVTTSIPPFFSIEFFIADFKSIMLCCSSLTLVAN
ncbi:hypothetical protein A2U01_0036197 [Trifolium medium]|uniref:Uncharacterized protein n=1 Tax=Trifolium medium TaxID=97028 RepID=A0A392PTQ0_9FABA|nr:hypothetical protein [Trifolium medium]